MAEDIWEGELLEKRVVIWSKDALQLYDDSGFGKFNENRLELELIEATYLAEKGKLKVKKKGKKKAMPLKDLMETATEEMSEFNTQYVVYRDLRERGYLVKTGFKFGCHFRVYERGVKLKHGPKAPHEHTKWIVHAVAEESAFSLPELSRAVRLAHNIRATMLWAVVDKESDVTYYLISRITP